jgi:hypothetical protein
VGLYLRLLEAALPDPGVETASQSVLGDPLSLLVEEEVGEGDLPGWDEIVADL